MKKILFRADAAPHIGIGDLMSLIHLSSYLEKEWERYFIIRNYSAGVLLTEKYSVPNTYIIDADISIEDEVAFLNSFIDTHEINIVFLEITERKLSDYTGLTKYVKKACVNFDGYIMDNMDLVVDWDVEALHYFNVNAHPTTKFLLGPEYVILPQEFYSHTVSQRRKSTNHKKILIAMGGADEFDLTTRVTQSIINSGLNLELKIIVGSGYTNRNALEILLKQSNLKFTILQNITNMLEEYLDCDIGIGAGGLTSSELVASHTPAILIATYEHQIARCQYFDENRLAKYLGFKDFDQNELINTLLNPPAPLQTYTFKTQAIVEALNEF
jgi:UDP-2,4-diacetamido-2,4,6-trideoxy-beta-L-altropyranose hydrolase